MIKTLLHKYKDVLAYAVFGLLTTIVNIWAYWLFARIVGLSVLLSTIVAWFLAVLFAYLTNRNWVFHSEAVSFKEVSREIVFFFLCRIGTGIIDWLIMYVFVDLLNYNDIVIKAIANIVVIVSNYIASKLVIFKKNS